MYERIKLISLSANKQLACEIAKTIGIEIMPSQVTRFADNEILFEGLQSFRGDNVYIIQSTCNPANENLMELLICIDACRRAGSNSITCVIPYFGYARQDRKAKARQPITAKLVANLLTVAGADRIVTIDLHVSQIAGFFDIPVDDCKALPLFVKYFQNLNLDNVVCVSPDHGGVVRTSKLADKLNAPLAIIDKRRPRPNESEIIAVMGNVKDKICIIFDDMVDTGGTLCNAAKMLKSLGAKKVYAAISHGVLSRDAVTKINNSVIEKLIITDSIELPESKKSPKIEVLSLAPILSKIIISLEEGKSLGDAINKFYEEGK